jgi:hypothetical protein
MNRGEKDMAEKYVLPTPTREHVLRMKEVVFYMCFHHIFKRLYATNFLYELAILCEIEPQYILHPYDELKRQSGQPSKAEISVTLRYCNVPYREIYKWINLHPTTVSRYLKKYCNGEYVFKQPKLPPAYYDEIDAALIAIEKVLSPFVFALGDVYIGQTLNKFLKEG